MASGKKNYFRHHFNARNDDKIQDLTDKFGPSGYFYFFVLVELQAEKCADDYQEICIYHQRTLIKELRLHKNKLKVFLEYSKSISLISYTYTENRVEICMPNLSKYMGRYTAKIQPNSSNKSKEKESKVKESKVNIYDLEKDLLNHWNDAKIIQHKSDDKKYIEIQKALKKKKNFSIEEIKKAIIDYASIVNSELTYFTHRWNVIEFLSRKNAECFYGENFIEGSYLSSKPFQNNNEQSQASDVPIHIQRGFHRLNVTENPYKEQFYKDQDKNNE